MITTKKLEKIIYVFAIVALIMPLVFLQKTYVFPFIVPKVIFFRTIAAFMLGAYIMLLISNKKVYGTKLKGLNIAVALFFASFLISTFFGVDWYRSMWDGHERMLGLFTLFHYVVYYYVCVSIIKEWKQWKTMLMVFLGIGIILMLLGIKQRFFDPDFLLNRGFSRVSATLGNPIYFSGFGMFMFFMSGYLFVKERVTPVRIYAAIAGILGLLGVFLGGSRGILLGILTGSVVGFVLYWFLNRSDKKINIRFATALGIMVIVCGGLFSMRTNPTVENIPALGRLLNTSISGGSFTSDTRVMAWEIALEAAKEKPIFGWGPNNYMIAFNQFYKPEFLRYGWNETWFDNAHSAPLNTLAVQGGVGFVTYILLFVYGFIVLTKAYKRKDISSGEFALLSSFLAGHFAGNIFIFENPTSYLYFFFVLALIQVRTTSDSKHEEHHTANTISSAVVIGVSLVILLFVYATEVNPARANRQSLNVAQALLSGQDNALDLYDEALQIPTPHIDDIRSDFSRNIGSALPRYSRQGNKEYIRVLIYRAFEEMEDNKRLHPKDIRPHIEQSGLARKLTRELNDTSLFFQTEEILEQALKYAPKRQQIIYMLANLKTAVGKQDEAIAMLEEAVAADNTIGEGIWRLGNEYIFAKEYDKALELIDDAEERNVSFNQHGLSMLEAIRKAANEGLLEQ